MLPSTDEIAGALVVHDLHELRYKKCGAFDTIPAFSIHETGVNVQYCEDDPAGTLTLIVADSTSVGKHEYSTSLPTVVDAADVPIEHAVAALL